MAIIPVDRSYIKKLVAEVLEREFRPGEKRRVLEYPDRLNYACPLCGDSQDDRKKRGNLYLNRLYHICFNCGAKMTLDRMCARFGVQVDLDRKIEMADFISSQSRAADPQDDAEWFDSSRLFLLDDLARALSSGEHGISGFGPVQPGGEVSAYLADRMIVGRMRDNIYQAWYRTDKWRSEPILCLLNRKGDRVISVQVRNLKQGRRRMFKVYNYEALYRWVNGAEAAEELYAGQLATLNKLSYYFNIMNVDFAQEVTVFEGYLDSLFFPNSIGVIGVNTSTSFLEGSSGARVRYFFDNDAAGHKKSEEKLREGHPVFLWGRLFEHVVGMKPGADPYKLMHRISKVKDLNELCVLTGGSCARLAMDKHFSSDVYDLRHIPKRAGASRGRPRSRP